MNWQMLELTREEAKVKLTPTQLRIWDYRQQAMQRYRIEKKRKIKCN